MFNDPYLSETQKCKLAYAGQKPFENLLIKAQGRKVLEPIANSIWKLIILDKYVDFEKLYATLDPTYNPNDEAKELNERFSLLDKNSLSSKCAVVTEAEWMRLYDVWAGATIHFYPHRKAELASYRDLIVNMFRAALSPSPAIKFDRDSRERYSHQPYRLDSCKDVLPFPLLSLLLACSESSPSTQTGVRGVLEILKRAGASALRLFARIGIWVHAMAIRATMVASTMSAASAVNLIKLKTELIAMPTSTFDDSNREQWQLAAATSKARDARVSGTQQLKRKATDYLAEIPRFKRGFVWKKSQSSPLLSPSTSSYHSV
jgi:hypothetical protein